MAGTVSSPSGSASPSSGHGWEETYGDHPVNELLAQKAGSQSPFGDDVTFPLPLESLYYAHPGPESRPNR